MLLATVDMESSAFNPDTGEDGGKIDLVGFYDGEQYYHFKNAHDFLEWLWDNMKKYNKYYIYAHNGGGYDYQHLLMEFDNPDWKDNYQLIEIHGNMIAIDFFKKIRGQRYRVFFRDSYRIMPSSLAKLGVSFKGPNDKEEDFIKMEMPNNLRKEMAHDKYMELMVEYNKRDCVVLYNIVERFFSVINYEGKRMPLTAASLAFKLWKQMLGISMMCEITNAVHYDEFIREAYAGGRVEVFKKSISVSHGYYDVNSLFPFIMENNKFPVGKCSFIKTESEVAKCFSKGMPGIYKVNWTAPPDLHIPILWSRDKKKLMFALHKKNQMHGEGTYTYPELKLAQDNGYLITPFECIVFFQEKDIFSEYVSKFKKMKFEGGAKKEIAKILSNCYSEDTECLSEDGWVRYNDLKEGMNILTYNHKTGHSEYQPIKKIFINEYEGDMHHFVSENVDLLVTPNHRIYWYPVTKIKTDNFVKTRKQVKDIHVRISEAERLLYNTTPIVIRSAGLTSSKSSYYRKPLIKLLAWIITEGMYYKATPQRPNAKNFGIRITQSEHYNKEYINDIKNCLDMLQIKYTEYLRPKDSVNYLVHDFYIGVKDAGWIKKLIPDKKIQQWWISKWGYDDLSVLFWTLMKGDGSFRKAAKATYVSKDNSELDKVQQIATLLGIKSSVSYKHKVVNLKLRRNALAIVNSKQIIPYKGKTWCVSVDNLNIFVRRNGKVSNSGQSLYGKTSQRPISKSMVHLSPLQVYNMVRNKLKVTIIDKTRGLYAIEVKRNKFDIAVIYGAYITSLARCYMWEQMRKCGFDIIYMDTDSLVVPLDMERNFEIDDKKYGAFKREGIIYRAEFFAPKCYLMDIDIMNPDTKLMERKIILKMKGVPDIIIKKQKKRTYDEILAYIKSKPIMEAYKITKFKEGMKLKGNFRVGDSRKVVKELSLNYDKREVLEDGSTLPW